MKALSDCLYSTYLVHQELQEKAIEFLLELVAKDVTLPRDFENFKCNVLMQGKQKLPSSLQMFKKNAHLLKDFCENPSLPGFDSVNSSNRLKNSTVRE